MPMVSEQYRMLVGVDTHAATHTLAVVDALTGAEVDQQTFPATPAGCIERSSGRRAGDDATLFVIEAVGSSGAGLVRLVGTEHGAVQRIAGQLGFGIESRCGPRSLRPMSMTAVRLGRTSELGRLDSATWGAP